MLIVRSFRLHGEFYAAKYVLEGVSVKCTEFLNEDANKKDRSCTLWVGQLNCHQCQIAGDYAQVLWIQC